MLLYNYIQHEYDDYLAVWHLLENGQWEHIGYIRAQQAKDLAMEPDNTYACFRLYHKPNRKY